MPAVSTKSNVRAEPFSGVERVQIAWVGGKETGNQPKSCFDCPLFYINQKRCQIHGPDIIIDRVFKDGQQYTPVCVYQKGGTPLAVQNDHVVYNVTILGAEQAELTGLEWAKGTGTNCGGYAGGAPCIHFISPDGVDGICELIKKNDNKVDWDDCSNGHEGEHIEWKEAQKLLKAMKPTGYSDVSALQGLGVDLENS